jgi:hypothetical protein
LAGSQLARSACLAVNQVKVTPLFVAYCENVTVVGSPILKLDDGGTATYTSGPGTSVLTLRVCGVDSLMF